MDYNGLSSDDDDLFSENTTQEKTTFVSDTETNLDNLISSLEINEDFINDILFRSRVIVSLLDTSNKFIYETNSYNRAIFNTLNSLTNNQFQYTLYAETLEESIYRRFIILEFLNSCIDTFDEEDLQTFSNIAKFNIDSKFINTYFASTRNILKFSISYNIDVYLKLCESINRQPIVFDFENVTDAAYDYIKTTSYINNIFTNIRSSLGFGTKLETD